MDEYRRSKPISVTQNNSPAWLYTTPLERFEAGYIPEPNSGCWIWTRPLTSTGYGRFVINKRLVLVHRFSYQTFKGPLVAGLVIDHLCRNRCCVNPDHLDQVTPSENARRIPLSTHCAKGHEWTKKSTWFNPRNGFRQCRICNLISQRKTQQRRRQMEAL